MRGYFYMKLGQGGTWRNAVRIEAAMRAMDVALAERIPMTWPEKQQKRLGFKLGCCF
jgi:hypothetical protein